jgi:type I restriction enzyme S subunit
MRVPEGWKLKRLDKVAQIQTGIAKNQQALSDYVELPYLRVANVQDGFLDLSEIKTIRIEKSKVQRYLLKNRDVLLTEGGDFDKLGRGAVWKASISFCVHQNHVFVVRVDDTILLAEHLSALTSSSFGKRYFISCSKQSTNLASINSSQLKAFPVLLPPLPEQKAIAALLSTWDEAIEKTERLIGEKEKRLDAYARDLFDSKSDNKHKGWKVVKLKTVLTEHGDNSTGTEEVYSVSVHKGLVNQVEHLGRSFSAANTDKYNRVHYGDIVYTKSPTGDFPLGIVKQSYTEKDVIVSPLYGVFTPITFNLGIVFDFYFSSPARARNYLFPIVQKGAKNTIAITNKTFLSKTLHLPVSEQAQKDVAEFVYAAREEIDLLKQLADKYKAQKRGLMQKMLTGEWRVKLDVEKTFEETKS